MIQFSLDRFLIKNIRHERVVNPIRGFDSMPHYEPDEFKITIECELDERDAYDIVNQVIDNLPPIDKFHSLSSNTDALIHIIECNKEKILKKLNSK